MMGALKLLLKGSTPSRDLVRENTALAEKLIDRIDRALADQRAEDALKQMGKAVKVNGHHF